MEVLIRYADDLDDFVLVLRQRLFAALCRLRPARRRPLATIRVRLKPARGKLRLAG